MCTYTYIRVQLTSVQCVDLIHGGSHGGTAVWRERRRARAAHLYICMYTYTYIHLQFKSIQCVDSIQSSMVYIYAHLCIYSYTTHESAVCRLHAWRHYSCAWIKKRRGQLNCVYSYVHRYIYTYKTQEPIVWRLHSRKHCSFAWRKERRGQLNCVYVCTYIHIYIYNSRV